MRGGELVHCWQLSTAGTVQCVSECKTNPVKCSAICRVIIVANVHFRYFSCMHVRATQNL